MSQIAVRVPRDGDVIAPFDPQATVGKIARADAVIRFAAKVKDWPLVYEAIDAKIEDQAEFVRWWSERVSKNQGARTDLNADRGLGLPRETAESSTGVTQQQVSRWRKSLGMRFGAGYSLETDPAAVAKYREKLALAIFRKADLEAAENHRAEGTGENEWNSKRY